MKASNILKIFFFSLFLLSLIHPSSGYNVVVWAINSSINPATGGFSNDYGNLYFKSSDGALYISNMNVSLAEKQFTSDGKIYGAAISYKNGLIYLANFSGIYYSLDYGVTFIPYRNYFNNSNQYPALMKMSDNADYITISQYNGTLIEAVSSATIITNTTVEFNYTNTRVNDLTYDYGYNMFFAGTLNNILNNTAGTVGVFSLSPPGAGNIMSVATNPTSSIRYYINYSGTGVQAQRSWNNGKTWNTLNVTLLNEPFSNIRITPDASGVIISNGNRTYYSINYGATFTQYNNSPYDSAGNMPLISSKMLDLLLQGNESGVYESIDYGNSWTKILNNFDADGDTYNYFVYALDDINKQLIITPSSFYNITPYSDNYYITLGNGVTVSDVQNYVIQPDDTIYTFPNFQQSGLNYSLMQFLINSSQNGYYQTVCNFQGAQENALLYNINFDNCNSAIDCGFSPSPSSYDWYTAVFDISQGRQLQLFNNTFAFSKYYPFTSTNNITYFDKRLSMDFRPGDNSSTYISLESPYMTDLLNLEIVRNSSQVCINSYDNINTRNNSLNIFCLTGYSAIAPGNLEINFFAVDVNGYHSYYLKLNDTNTGNSIITPTYRSLYGNYPLSSVKFSTFAQSNNTYVDNIKLFGITPGQDSFPVTVPYITQCIYNISQCYTTRIYFSWNSNDFTTFKDFHVCGVKDFATINSSSIPGQSITTSDGTQFSLFPASNSVSAASKILYVILTIIITTLLIMGLFIAISSLTGLNVNLIGAFLTGLIDVSWLFYFIVIAYIPFWMVLIMVLLTTGIIVLWIRKGIDSPTNNNGG